MTGLHVRRRRFDTPKNARARGMGVRAGAHAAPRGTLAQPMRDYTEQDWLAENTTLQHGVDPQPCPQCGWTGFYSTREADPPPGETKPRRYRGCKFCGFWQDVGKQPDQLIRYECHHPNGTVRHDWKYPRENWNCPDCGTHYEPSASVRWPADDPRHPWRNVPQHRSQAYYLAHWLAQGLDARPFGVL